MPTWLLYAYKPCKAEMKEAPVAVESWLNVENVNYSLNNSIITFETQDFSVAIGYFLLNIDIQAWLLTSGMYCLSENKGD